MEPCRVELWWIPLGAGETTGCVRWNGRAYEAAAARLARRPPRDLYHSALQVSMGADRWALEMTPVWGNGSADRGVVAEGPVGARWLGRSRLFRYEVRRWRDGRIPDLGEAVGGAQLPATDPVRARRLLELAPTFPTATWGRDELGAGEMWNSNSLTAWLLACSGHRTDDLAPPDDGRAPGWSAGLVAAARQGRDLHDRHRVGG